MAIAVSALLSAPAQANISMPGGGMYIPGPLGFPGFGIGGHASAGASGNSTGFGLPTPCGFAPCLGPFSFGLNGAPQGGNVNHSDFGISTPFGGINAGGFGIVSPFGFGVGNAGPGAGGHYTGFGLPCGFMGMCAPSPFGFGLNNQQNVGISTPFGGINMGGFGIVSPFGFGVGNAGPGAGGHYTGFGLGMPCGFIGPCMPNPVGFGLNSAQNVGLTTGQWGPSYGISTPWGGMNAGGFGFGAQPQIMPIYLPYPY